MLAWLVLLLVCVLKIHTLPASYEGTNDSGGGGKYKNKGSGNGKFVDWIPDMYEDSCPPCPDAFTSLLDQTKDLGASALDHITFAASSVGSSVGGLATDMLKSGVKQAADLLVTGHDLVASNLKGAKKLGAEGLAMADKAFNYFTENLPSIPKFSSIELRSQESFRQQNDQR